MNKEFGSKLAEKYSSKYDKRFGKLESNGEIFEPKLHRYDSIFRYFQTILLEGKLVNSKHVRLQNLSSVRKSLFTGIKLVNDSIKYNFSDKVIKVYHVNEWEKLLGDLVNEEICTFDGIYYGPNLSKCRVHTEYYSRQSHKKEDYMNGARRVDELYLKVLKDLAYESYNNLNDWEPHKFTIPAPWNYDYTELGETFISDRDEALISLSRLRTINTSMESLEEVFRRKEIVDFCSKKHIISESEFERELDWIIGEFDTHTRNVVRFCLKGLSLMKNPFRTSIKKGMPVMKPYSEDFGNTSLFDEKNDFNENANEKSNDFDDLIPPVFRNKEESNDFDDLKDAQRIADTYGLGFENRLQSENEDLKVQVSELKEDNLKLKGRLIEVKEENEKLKEAVKAMSNLLNTNLN